MHIRNNKQFDIVFPYAGADKKGWRVKAGALSPEIPPARFHDQLLQRDWRRGTISVILNDFDKAVLGPAVADLVEVPVDMGKLRKQDKPETAKTDTKTDAPVKTDTKTDEPVEPVETETDEPVETVPDPVRSQCQNPKCKNPKKEQLLRYEAVSGKMCCANCRRAALLKVRMQQKEDDKLPIGKPPAKDAVAVTREPEEIPAEQPPPGRQLPPSIHDFLNQED